MNGCLSEGGQTFIDDQFPSTICLDFSTQTFSRDMKVCGLWNQPAHNMFSSWWNFKSLILMCIVHKGHHGNESEPVWHQWKSYGKYAKIHLMKSRWQNIGLVPGHKGNLDWTFEHLKGLHENWADSVLLCGVCVLCWWEHVLTRQGYCLNWEIVHGNWEQHREFCPIGLLREWVVVPKCHSIIRIISPPKTTGCWYPQTRSNPKHTSGIRLLQWMCYMWIFCCIQNLEP